MKRAFGIFLLVMLFATNAFAASVLVDCVASGTPGDYLLNFTVTNNIPAQYNQMIYMWGIDILPSTSLGRPTNWQKAGVPNGDWSETYPNGWFVDPWGEGPGSVDNRIDPGVSLSGFSINVASIPDEINFLAWSYPYTAGDTPTFQQSLAYSYIADDTWPVQSDPSTNPNTNPCIFGKVGGLNGSSDGGEGNGVVPEPASIVLMGLGATGAFLRRRNKRL